MISDGEPPISVRRRAICHRRTDYALRSELRRCKRRDIASGSRRPGVRDLVAQESHRQHSAVPMYLTAARAGGFGVSFPPRNTNPAPGPGKPIVQAPKARDPTGMALGTVKFFKPEKGYGAITSPELPDGFDAWVHFSAIEMDGYRSLDAGDQVEFDYESAQQDSFRFVATRVRKL